MSHVLIVEDNELNRDMLSRRLARKGFMTTIAENGERALELLAGERPDIILMDLSLPRMDGWETTRRIKSDPQLAAIPVIALTAHARREDEKLAMEAGCDDFATKPIDFNALLAKISHLTR